MNVIEEIEFYKEKSKELGIEIPTSYDMGDGQVFEARDYQESTVLSMLAHCKEQWIKVSRKEQEYSEHAISTLCTGAGKGAIIAFLCKYFNSKNAKLMVLTRDPEIVKQNHEVCFEIGGKNSVFSGSLKLKSVYHNTVIGSEKTVKNNLQKTLSESKFECIVIDEAHQLDPVKTFKCLELIKKIKKSYDDKGLLFDCDTFELDSLVDENDNKFPMFSVIIAYYTIKNPRIVFLGLTGTPYRGIDSIIGKFWKKRIGPNVSLEYLVSRDMLVDFSYGVPEFKSEKLEVDINVIDGDGDLDSSEHNKIGDSLTDSEVDGIVGDFYKLTEPRLSTLISCSSKAQMRRVKQSLDLRFLIKLKERLELSGVDFNDEINLKEAINLCERNKVDSSGGSVVITQSVPDRAKKMDLIKSGYYKYTIQLIILTTGVDVPIWDSIVIMRPIMSPSLYIQLLGRGARKLKKYHTDKGMVKDICLVIDYTKSSMELSHFRYNPILEEANYQLMKKKGIEPTVCCGKKNCGEMNFKISSRCRGIDSKTGERCDFFFDGVKCSCGVENDKRATECRECGKEMYDPIKNLEKKHYTESSYRKVNSVTYTVMDKGVSVKILFEDSLDNGKKSANLFFAAFDKDGRKIKFFHNRFSKRFVSDKQALRGLWNAKNKNDIRKYEKHFNNIEYATHRVSSKGGDIIAHVK